MPVPSSSVAAVSPCIPAPSTDDAGGITPDQFTSSYGDMIIGGVRLVSDERESSLGQKSGHWVFGN